MIKMGKAMTIDLSSANQAEEEDTLNHYMECMIELLTSCSQWNGEKSTAGMIAKSLSNSVPLLNNLETPLGPESPR